MNMSTKLLAIIGTLVFLSVLAVTIYEIRSIGARQTAIESQIVQQKELADNITRAMATWATKADIEQFAKDSNTNLDVIKKDLATLNATVTAINVSSANSQGQSGNNIASTGSIKIPGTKPATTVCDGKEVPCADPYGYQTSTQQFVLNEEFKDTKVPIGTVGFSASQAEPWNYSILPRQYNSVTVLGTDENQRLYAYNKFSINVDNKNYDVPVTTSKIEQEYPSAKFSFWNPRLYLTAGGAVNVSAAPVGGSANMGVNVGIMSYGQYKNSPDISILQMGLGYQTETQRPSVEVSPINFNLRPIFPKGLVDNTYVGPSVQLDTGGNVFTGANLSIGF